MHFLMSFCLANRSGAAMLVTAARPTMKMTEMAFIVTVSDEVETNRFFKIIENKII